MNQNMKIIGKKYKRMANMMIDFNRKKMRDSGHLCNNKFTSEILQLKSYFHVSIGR